jgi:hypothetical protein
LRRSCGVVTMPAPARMPARIDHVVRLVSWGSGGGVLAG